jgi:predicted TIM-barrel fold metal-dependent hydrolase
MIDFPVIDTHIHLLDQKRFGYSWAKGAPALKRGWTAGRSSELASPCVSWLEYRATSDFAPQEKRKLFRDNAIKAYRLNP